MKHVMVDIETLGNRAGCAILAIGAVRFDPIKQLYGEKFYYVVDAQSCFDVGLRAQGSTIYWWFAQGERARAALCVAKRVPIGEALKDFANWFGSSTFLWAHGASFDGPILETAYAVALRQETPWKFKNTRDTRTLFDLAGVKVDRKVGTHHNALDDAVAQAVAVCKAYRKLKGEEEDGI